MNDSSDREGNDRDRCLAPNAGFLLITVSVTLVATVMLTTAILTQHWEQITWDPKAVKDAITNNRTKGMTITGEWYLDGVVARLSLFRNVIIPPSTSYQHHRKDHYEDSPADQPNMGLSRELAVLFLIPMHGGIWTLCPSISAEETKLLGIIGYPEIGCINYLTPIAIKSDEQRSDWQHRMQNLSMSCALVCLIIIGSSALVGSLGIIKHQISAVLVTGVMYLLAATFAMFTLMMIHFKRERAAGNAASKDCSSFTLPDGMIPLQAEYREDWPLTLKLARNVNPGWSLDLGWTAAAVTAFASALWILLAKVMRYNPLSTIL